MVTSIEYTALAKGTGFTRNTQRWSPNVQYKVVFYLADMSSVVAEVMKKNGDTAMLKIEEFTERFTLTGKQQDNLKTIRLAHKNHLNKK